MIEVTIYPNSTAASAAKVIYPNSTAATLYYCPPIDSRGTVYCPEATRSGGCPGHLVMR